MPTFLTFTGSEMTGLDSPSMGKVTSTKGSLGTIDVGLTVASGGNSVALY